MKKLVIAVAILVSIMVLGSCGGGAPSSPTPTATETPPALPTFTPTAPPTPTSPPTLPPTPGPRAVTDAYVEAFNAGDIEGLRSIYADGAVFTIENLPFGPEGAPFTHTYTGKSAAVEENLRSVAANARITLSGTSVVGDALRGGFSYTDDDELGGLGPLTGTLETLVVGGVVTRVTMTFDDETYRKWKAVVAPAPLVPIAFSEGATGRDVMDQLPTEDGECIRQSLGEEAYGQLLRSDFSQDSSLIKDEVLSRCLSNESISRFLGGFVASELGGLSDGTIGCMGSALSSQDLKAIFSSETAWGEAFQAMDGCLSDDERARADASGFFGGGDEEDPIGSPGLVDVDGRQIYLACEGEGGPTVVLEAGGRGNSGSWHLVQPFVADFTRVCAYDRAGAGYSESVSVNEHAEEIADELHGLLATAGVDGPYVLVGHSLGGILVRVFANRYLNEVAGMVLVDTGHGDPVARFQEVLTEEEWQQVRDVVVHQDDGFTFPGGLGLLGPDLGDIPLVVLTAARRGASPLPADIAERMIQVIEDTQEELLSLSSNSTHIIAEESGHGIQQDQPDLVIYAIRRVVEDVSGRKTTAQPAPRRAPPPQLKIVGNQIKNIHGEQAVLRGVAVADPFMLATRDNHFVREDYRVLAEEWGADIIRVPILPRTWQSDQRYMEKYLDPLVQWGGELGLYIFLGWHAHGNPITGFNPYPRLDNPDPELAKAALGAIALRYRDKPWVLYGTFNEPTRIAWSEWRPVAEELVDAVHAVHPEALVFVSGVDWGYDLRGAIEDPVRRNNIIYETHPYPGTGAGWKAVLDELGKTAPVFIGEWGFDRESPNSNLRGTAANYGLPLIRHAEARDIGWTAWVWHPQWEPTMLTSWNEYPMTEFGLVVKIALGTKTLTRD